MAIVTASAAVATGGYWKSTLDAETSLIHDSIGDSEIGASISTSSTTHPDANLANSSHSFAIFTLPYRELGDTTAFSFSEYLQAMKIIRTHMETGRDFEDRSGYQGNHIIQSIRSIVRSDGIDETEARGPAESYSMSTSEDAQPFKILGDSQKMITIQSLDNITAAVKYSSQYPKVTHILYDIEHWSRTPEAEQDNPIQSISQASHGIHESSLDYGITPDANFLVENYRQINWTEIDFLGMQLQRFSQNITLFSAHAKEISAHVKAANPSTEVYVQLSFRFTDGEKMVEAIESAKPWVDGFVIAYLPTNSDCLPHCNPESLDTVLKSIRTGHPSGE